MKTTSDASSDVYTLPIVPVLETRRGWEAVLGEGGDPFFRFELAALNREIGTFTGIEDVNRQDAFEMRARFLSIRDAGSALAFFQEFGPYRIENPGARTAESIRLSEIFDLRDFYAHALTERYVNRIVKDECVDSQRDRGLDARLWHNLQMELLFRRPVAGIVRCKDVQDAMRATVFLDRLRGFQWRRCRREDCGKTFQVLIQRRRFYCSSQCAHLQAVRDYNRRKTAKRGG